MGDGGLHALGQQDGDAVSLFDALGLQHVGTAVGEALEIAKAVARLAAVGVEMDERQTIRVGPPVAGVDSDVRSEEHTSALQSLMRISYAVFCVTKTIHHM